MRAFAVLLLSAVAALAAPAQQPVMIDVNLAKPVGPYKPIYSWFGYDEGNYTTMKDGQRLLRELHDLSPVPVHIRFHHLLTSGNGEPELKWSSTNVFTLDASGKPVYNFAIMDKMFDSLKRAGVRPMVELGFMPKDLAAEVPGRTEPYQVHYPKDTISGASNNPPRNYAIWGELVRKVTEHLVERYGKSEVLQWYFEVWNEPDIGYWHASEADYFKLYDYAVAGVRAALPGARVGGPATTGPGDPHAEAYLDHFLEHVSTGESAADGKTIPIDFISFHVKGQPKIVDGHVRMGLDREMISADKGFAAVAKYPKLLKLPIILSEADPEGCAACSSKVNPSNNYRNDTLYPAYTAAALKGLFQLDDRHRTNLISMLSWSFEFEDKDFFEGFRSLSTNGVDKPILNLFRMAGLMSGDRVVTTSTGEIAIDDILKSSVTGSPDVDALATHDGKQAAVLVWNYEDNDVPAQGSSVKVHVNGIPAGVSRVLLQHYRIDDSHSNAYTVWKGMGSPQKPSPEQFSTLHAAGQLQMLDSPVWLDVQDGAVNVAVTMPRQSVSLMHLSW
jgi:xylan 1,4-beta-xylosidase